MPIVVRRSSECFYSLEARRRAGYCRCRTCCNVPKDRSQSTAVLQKMRWPSFDQSSSAWIGGCICSDLTDVEVHRGCPRQLCRDSFAYAGRTSQAEGFSQRIWRLWRGDAGVRGRCRCRSMSAFTGKADNQWILARGAGLFILYFFGFSFGRTRIFGRASITDHADSLNLDLNAGPREVRHRN